MSQKFNTVGIIISATLALVAFIATMVASPEGQLKEVAPPTLLLSGAIVAYLLLLLKRDVLGRSDTISRLARKVWSHL